MKITALTAYFPAGTVGHEACPGNDWYFPSEHYSLITIKIKLTPAVM